MRRGFTLLSALLAIGLAALFMTGIMMLALSSNHGTGKALKYQRALWVAQEGIETLKTIAFADLQVSSSTPETLPGGFMRTTRVKQTNRDASCFLVPSGGTADPDTKAIESEVSWSDPAGRSQKILLTGIRTRWGDPQGTCFGSIANRVLVDISQGEWFGQKQLRTAFIKNNGTTNITIDKMVLTWDNSRKLQQIFLDSDKVWSSGGPGTPSGDQSSGVIIDIQDATIAPGEQKELNKTQFSNNMVGSTVTIQIIFSDGSSTTTASFVPT